MRFYKKFEKTLVGMVFFKLFRGLLTSCLYKVSKKFWFTEIGLVDFEKNVSQI